MAGGEGAIQIGDMSSFTRELRSIRQRFNLTPAQAAKQIGIREQQYLDVEGEVVSSPYAEQVGFLVSLGTDLTRAREIINTPVVMKVSDFEKEFGDSMYGKPFVTIDDGEFVFDDREVPGHSYGFATGRVQSLLDVMGWIAHLSEKCWIQKEHLTAFSRLAMRHLKLDPHARRE